MDMHLPHYQRGKTIAAVATPTGEGAIAVLRISGPDALTVAQRIYSGPIDRYHSHTLHTGQILDAASSVIDHVLVAVFRAPRSYTGEETVEIHCHGGSLIARNVLERILEAGAQMALPGEFTFQAFVNGKLDLTQAEAVQRLIAAKSDLARQSAASQLEGSLSSHQCFSARTDAHRRDSRSLGRFSRRRTRVRIHGRNHRFPRRGPQKHAPTSGHLP